MPFICTCDHYNTHHDLGGGACIVGGCPCKQFHSPPNQAMHLDPDEVTMGHWARSEGTTPDISNEIAHTIQDIFNTYEPGVHVPWSVRYGIASELQRRLNITKKEE
jgi:hypothetical protein